MFSENDRQHECRQLNRNTGLKCPNKNLPVDRRDLWAAFPDLNQADTPYRCNGVCNSAIKRRSRYRAQVYHIARFLRRGMSYLVQVVRRRRRKERSVSSKWLVRCRSTREFSITVSIDAALEFPTCRLEKPRDHDSSTLPLLRRLKHGDKYTFRLSISQRWLILGAYWPKSLYQHLFLLKTDHLPSDKYNNIFRHSISSVKGSSINA